VEEGLSLEGKILRYSSVSLSPTLGTNEKVEQYIDFGLKVVSFVYMLALVSFLLSDI